jgi:Ankyrin repeats (3 copies)
LLYAAFSRVTGAQRSQAAVARLLLDHGADPNSGYLWDGTCLFTALTGAFGYGEDAPNQPPHPEWLGAGGAAAGPWSRRAAARTVAAAARRADVQPRLLLEHALAFAADLGYVERVGLLLERGVDPDGRGTRHPTLRGLRPVELASNHGAQDIVDLLLGAGARPPAVDEVARLPGLCMRGDREAVRRAIADDPGIATALRERRPNALVEAAERGKAPGVELLAELGYDIDGAHGHTALHVAAYQGDREMCALLLRLGAAPSARDASFDATAAGWARHAHHDGLGDWLEQRAGARTS